MTPDQERLIVDNLEFTRRLARRRFPHDDEYEGVAAETLCKAAHRWTTDTNLAGRYGEFGRYLRIVLRGALIDFRRRWHRNTPRTGRRTWRILSIDTADTTGTNTLLDGTALRERALADLVAETVDNETVIAQIKPQVLTRARRRADGYSLTEVAAETGITGAAVCQSFLLEAHRLARVADRDVIRGTRTHHRTRIRRSA